MKSFSCEEVLIFLKQDLINAVVLRMKKSIEEDVFIPLYPKR